MGDALFTIVREDDLDTTEDLDYSAASVVYSAQDEIELVDDLGNPCAFPASQGHVSVDITHDYTDGSEGVTPVALRHQINLSVDMIDSDTRRRLQTWQQDRARVLFTPGYGRHTLLGWRPVPASAAYVVDLTGRYQLNIEGDSTREHVWDDIMGQDVMREGFTEGQRIIATPGGAGQVFERDHENLASPDSPESGNLGWTAGGTAAGTLTLTYASAEFGHNDCSGAMGVVGTATANARNISRTLPASGSGGPTGEGTVNAAIWVKGRLPTDARLEIQNNAAVVHSVDLDGDYSDWTRVDIQGDSTAFSSGNVDLIVVMPFGANDQTCDFFVGPTMITWEASTSRHSQPYPQWVAEGAARTEDYLETNSSLEMPKTGTIFSSFYAPEWYEDQDSAKMGLCGYTAGTGGALYLIAYDGNTNMRLAFEPTTSQSYGANATVVAGAVNSAAATWDHDSFSLYFNGALVQEYSGALYYDKSFRDSNYRVGSTASDHGAWPLIMNTLRIEQAAWSADRIAGEHETLSNPLALETVIAARGRTYMIDSIPSTPVVVGGTNYFRGALTLRQVDYDSTLADITSAEQE